MDLRANAIITAVDRFSGPMQRMAGVMNQFSGQAAVVANASRRAGAAVGGMGITGAFGFGLLLQQAERFNQAVFGVGVASVTEAMDKFGNVDVSRMQTDMSRVEESSMRLSQNLRMSATELAKVQETFAKAGFDAEKLESYSKAAATLWKTDPGTPIDKMAEFLHTASVIYKPKDGEKSEPFARRISDMVLAAAAETKLSVGGVIAGLTPFQTIGAGMGLQFEDQLSLLMTAVQRGFDPIVIGTALRSDMVRMFKPTASGFSVISRILTPMGLSLADFAQTSAQEPMKALAGLRSISSVVSGKFSTRLKDMIQTANKDGSQTSDGFILTISEMIAKEMGVTDYDGRGKIRTQVMGAITAPTGTFKLLPLWAALMKGGMSQVDQDTIFEARHSAKNKPIFAGFESGENEANRKLLERMHGQGLDAVETLWSKSAFGNMKAMSAAWERIMIRFANSPGIQAFVNGLERIAAAIERADPLVVQIGAWGAIALVAAGPIAMLAGGLASLVAVMSAPIAATLAAIAASAVMLKDGFHPAVVTAFAASLGVLALAGAPVTAAVVGIGAAAVLMMKNWEPVKQFFSDTWDGIKSGFQSLLDFMSSKIDWLMGAFERLGAVSSALGDRRWGDAWDMLKGGDLPRTSNNDRMEPLARTGDELIRSLTGGSGRIEVQGAATIRLEPIRVEVVGGRAVGPQQGATEHQVPLRTGTSLGDVGPAP